MNRNAHVIVYSSNSNSNRGSSNKPPLGTVWVSSDVLKTLTDNEDSDKEWLIIKSDSRTTSVLCIRWPAATASASALATTHRYQCRLPIDSTISLCNGDADALRVIIASSMSLTCHVVSYVYRLPIMSSLTLHVLTTTRTMLLPPVIALRELLHDRPLTCGLHIAIGLRDGGYVVCYVECDGDGDEMYRIGETTTIRMVPSLSMASITDDDDAAAAAAAAAAPISMANITDDSSDVFDINLKDYSPAFTNLAVVMKALMNHGRDRLLLVSGPGGCGKTRVLSKLTAWPVVHVRPATLYARYPGETLRGLGDLYAYARRCSPAVLLCDNADALFPAVDGEELAAKLVSLLSSNDTTSSSSFGVLIVMIVRQASDISPRVLHTIDHHVSIPAPNTKLLYNMLSNYGVSNTSEIAAYCQGFTGADIEGLCALASTRNDDLEWAFPRLRVGAGVRLSGKQDISDNTDGDIGWLEVGGLEMVKQKLMDAVLLPQTHAELLKMTGVCPSRGVLLYGPPGTGKTLLARAVARETQAQFLTVNIADIIRAELGESERLLREVFSCARAMCPCIVFIDELQALFNVRGGSGDISEKLTSALMCELEVMPPGVVFLAATNTPDHLDPAILRPGRIDTHLYVPPPGDADARTSIIRIVGRRLRWRSNVLSDDDVNTIACATSNFTGADLRNLCRRAGLAAVDRVLRGGRPIDSNIKVEVSLEDFMLDIGKPSVSNKELSALRNWKPPRH